MVNIGTVDCEASAKLCKKIGYSDDLVYFKGDVGPKKGEVNNLLNNKIIEPLNLTEDFLNHSTKGIHS